MKTEIRLEDIITIADLNSFNFLRDNGAIPATVVVFRNMLRSAGSYQYVPDDGDNLTDTVCLVDSDGVIALKGRSYPHDKYQARQAEGTGKANYIASGYYPAAWVRGFHRGQPALVQKEAFTIWRSKDMDLRDYDSTPEDDFTVTDIVANNFHGLAPYSAGCVTVFGSMNPPSNDWAIAHDWIYKKHRLADRYGAMIMSNNDFAFDVSSLRLGSTGRMVRELQQYLFEGGFGLFSVDGYFGPLTFESVRSFQRAANLPDTGIFLEKDWETLVARAASGVSV